MENEQNKDRRAPRLAVKPRKQRQPAAKKPVKPQAAKAEKPAKQAKPAKAMSAQTANRRHVKRGAKPVKLIFLGGVGEIGKNMTAIECGDDIIVIDAGAIFPTDETPGIDLIVPDIKSIPGVRFDSA